MLTDGNYYLGSRDGRNNICKICWWEDDGQNNINSDMAMGGPNYAISLSIGRYNYLIYGIYDQKRNDLMDKKSDEIEYEKGRIFEIVDEKYLIEKETNWKWKITLPYEPL